MGEVLGEVAALAVAVAASPFPIIPAILLLFTPRSRASSAGFLGGWVAGVAGATALFVVLATVIETAEETPTWAAWLRLGLGLVLVALGITKWWGRRAASEAPAWMRSIEGLTPATALRLGLLLSMANPKVLVLAGAAGVSIGAAELSGPQVTVAVLAFTAIASSTVALPLVLVMLFGDRVLGPLGTARGWLQDNNAAVMAVVLVVIGAALLAKGASGL